MRLRAYALLLLIAATAPLLAEAPTLVTRDVFLMGTRAALSLYAPSRTEGLGRLEHGLRVLEAAENQLSTWRDDSAVSRLNHSPAGRPWTAEPSLCAVFRDVYHWHRETGGAFDPGIGSLIAAWDIHGGGRVPTASEIAQALRTSGLERIVFDAPRCVMTRPNGVTVDVGAFGKGDALDRVAVAIGPGPWLIDLGGQITVGGAMPDGQPWTVDVADPRDRQRRAIKVAMRSGSLSTTAGSERDLEVNGVRVGHVLDPRTGRPAPYAGSVTVWHSSGLAADALSTALYVMGPEAGLEWARARNLAAAFLTPGPDGTLQLQLTETFAALLAREGARPSSSSSRSEAKQATDLDHDRTVLEVRNAARQGVASLVEDDEQLAAGPVLPPQPEVRGDAVDAGVVLDQRTDEHQRSDGVDDARSGQMRGEMPLRQRHAVQGVGRLEGELIGDVDARAVHRDRGSLTAVEAAVLHEDVAEQAALLADVEPDTRRRVLNKWTPQRFTDPTPSDS
jgi:thiamine biosynthesis lipoprotein